MWLQSELTELSKTFQSEHTLEDFLSEKEIDVIKENASRYANLHNGLVIPRHNAKVILFSIHISYSNSVQNNNVASFMSQL